MDKPQSFEEVFKDAYDYWIDDANIHRYEGAKGLADQVWQHQQAKVEELQTRYTQQGINMLKMQKRMELALGLLNTNNEDFPIKLIKADLNKVLRLEQALNEGNND